MKMFSASFFNLFLKHLVYCIDFARTSIPAWIGESYSRTIAVWM